MAGPMTETDRVIPLSGIHNFRDYGGYAASGGRLRRGLLWRSGQHADATPEDLETVHRLGIATVIDLRGDSEREKFPCVRHGAFDAAVVFHPGETAGLQGRAVHEESSSEIVTAADAHAAMVRLYETLAWRPILVGTYRLYFQALAGERAPSLLHCLAGKDRTGLGAALVHTVLGVHPDDVMADYLLTNSAGNVDRRIEAGAKHMRGNYGSRIEEAAIRALMSVEPDYLQTSLDQIRARHGSVEAYAEEVLGVGPELRAALAANLIE